MTRRLIAVILSAMFITGLVFAQEQAKKEEKKMEKKNPLVELETNYGNIYLEVFQNETPIHAANFLSKVDAGKYSGLTFHRIVKNFVIQGGDPKGTGYGRMDGPALADEKSPFPEVRGTVAMARSDSASNCQFYINLKDNTRLDEMKFSAFAKVVKGMDVVDQIAAVQKDQNDKPLQPVVMTKVHRVNELPAEEVKTTPSDKKTEEMKKASETEMKSESGQDSSKITK
jgi:peptidyl-prolyl cis-trans isomerase B (cyclophilin B)